MQLGPARSRRRDVSAQQEEYVIKICACAARLDSESFKQKLLALLERHGGQDCRNYRVGLSVAAIERNRDPGFANGFRKFLRSSRSPTSLPIQGGRQQGVSSGETGR